MTFMHPEFLYYMLPPLFILFGFLLTQKEPEAKFFDKEVLDKLRARSDSLTLKARNALLFLMGVFIIIALAKPIIKEGKVEVSAKSADIVVALDISDSMLAGDVYPNRLEAAKEKILEFLKLSKGERVGVIAFAKSSFLVSPLSFDLDAVSFLVSRLRSDSITQKGTDISSLLESVGKMRKDAEKKYLLIFSDGGDKSDLSQEISLAKKHGITVFVIGMGTKSGAPIKLGDSTFLKYEGEVVISKLNESISELALKSGGVYIENSTSLQDVKAMRKEIEAMANEKEFKKEEIQRYTPLFYYPIAAAMLLLLIATSSMKRGSSALGAVLVLVFFNGMDAEASMFDFMKLKEAREAYESGEYKKAAGIYDEYAKTSGDPSALYNAANAYYKAQKYDKAIESYKGAEFKEESAKADNLSNLGNAYAKSGELENALKSYEESLSLREDKETRENLQEVKKLIEQQKKPEQKEQEGDKEDSDDKGSDKNDEKSKDDKSGSDKKSSDGKEEESKEQKQDDKSKEQKKEDMSKESGKEAKNEKQDEASMKEENKDSNATSAKAEEQKQSDMSNEPVMSDEEQEKWLKQMNAQSNSYLYMLDESEKSGDTAKEKPW